MDAILEQARELFEGTIDFKGQALTDFLSTVLLTVSGMVAFLAGYITQNIYNTLYVGGAGTILTLLLVVPPWPLYNSHPLRWLPAKTAKSGIQGVQIQVDGKRIA